MSPAAETVGAAAIGCAETGEVKTGAGGKDKAGGGANVTPAAPAVGIPTLTAAG